MLHGIFSIYQKTAENCRAPMEEVITIPDSYYGDIVLIDQTYQHFEQLRNDVLLWDLDFRQLGAGQDGHRLVQFAGQNFSFAYCVFQCPYDQRSASPVGLRTFSILAENVTPSTWCGQDFGWNTLVSMPVGNEFRALSSGYFSNYIFSLTETLLQATAQTLFHTSWEKLAPDTGGSALEFDPGSMSALRGLLYELAAEAVTHKGKLNFSVVTEEIASLLIRGLIAAKSSPLRRAQINRQRYFQAAQDFIDHQVEAPVLMKDICGAVGVSERTLEYAFREQQHISPKSYLNCQRLARVRKVLAECAVKNTQIAEVANRYGFWHMGQFARDYRRVYRESPSETLARSVSGSELPGQ